LFYQDLSSTTNRSCVFSRTLANQGAEIVTNTGAALPSSLSIDDPETFLRRNTVAAPGAVEIEPDAILTSVELNFENPEFASRDQ
jgi:hypothetical protein